MINLSVSHELVQLIPHLNERLKRAFYTWWRKMDDGFLLTSPHFMKQIHAYFSSCSHHQNHTHYPITSTFTKQKKKGITIPSDFNIVLITFVVDEWYFFFIKKIKLYKWKYEIYYCLPLKRKIKSNFHLINLAYFILANLP